MTAFLWPVTCPQDGSEVTLVNSVSQRTQMVSVVACTHCRRQWTVSAQMRFHEGSSR